MSKFWNKIRGYGFQTSLELAIKMSSDTRLICAPPDSGPFLTPEDQKAYLAKRIAHDAKNIADQQQAERKRQEELEAHAAEEMEAEKQRQAELKAG